MPVQKSDFCINIRDGRLHSSECPLAPARTARDWDDERERILDSVKINCVLQGSGGNIKLPSVPLLHNYFCELEQIVSDR